MLAVFFLDWNLPRFALKFLDNIDHAETSMNLSEFDQLSLDELLALLPQAGYSFRTASGGWIHGAVEQTWDGDPQSIDREDVLTFLRRHYAFLHGDRQPDQNGDDCVVINDSAN